MCLSSGVLITDVCIRWRLFDICGFMHGMCGKFKSKNTVCYHVLCERYYDEDALRAFCSVYTAFEISNISQWCPGFHSKYWHITRHETHRPIHKFQ